MRRIASLAGVSLIAGGVTALVLFASAARGAPLALPLVGPVGNQISIAENGSNGSGEGSGASTSSTTIGGNGSGASTSSTTSTTASTSSSTSTSSSSSSTTTACTARISSTVQSVARGSSTSVGGACFPANTSIALTLFSDPISLGTAVTDSTGTFSVIVTIPTSVVAGTHTLTAAGGGQSASISLVVSNVLVRTGMSWNLAILGLALIAAGIIVMSGDRIGRQQLIDFQ